MKTLPKKISLLIILAVMFSIISPAIAYEHSVSNILELSQAISDANDGDTIILSSNFESDDITIDANGKKLVLEGRDFVWNKGSMVFVGTGDILIKDISMVGDAIDKRLLVNKMQGGVLTISNMVFRDTTKGAIMLNTSANANTIITNSWLINNKAGIGPAIELGSNSNLELNDSTIENSVGQGSGGYDGAAISGPSYYGTLNISNTTFRNNKNKNAFTSVTGDVGVIK